MSNRILELREELISGQEANLPAARPQRNTPRETLKQRLNDRERLARMEEKGEIKLGSGKIPAGFWTKSRPADPEGEIRAALLDERESSL